MIQAVTGCDQIGCFQGRVYRVAADISTTIPGITILENIVWSMSLSEQRSVLRRAKCAITRQADRGRGAKRRVWRCGYLSFVDRLQHRITNVAGSISKTAFAGWFRAQPDFRDLLRQRSQPRSEVTLTKQSSPALDQGVRRSSVCRGVTTS